MSDIIIVYAISESLKINVWSATPSSEPIVPHIANTSENIIVK